MAHEIVELQQDPENVLVLEWAGIADDFLTPDRLMVSFETTSENEREIVMSYPKTLAYLVESGA
jgi:tRNA A37 threonylcarbamoyladenosine biosynthesis protein TsaE